MEGVVSPTSRKRIYGAIETLFNPISTKIWKRLDPTGSIEEPSLGLKPRSFSCDAQNLSIFDYSYFIQQYQELMLSQYHTLSGSSSSGLNPFQEQVFSIAKEQIRLCLAHATAMRDKQSGLLMEEKMLVNLMQCYEHLFRGELLSLEFCDHNLQFNCYGTFSSLCELRIYYQLFVLGDFSLARSSVAVSDPSVKSTELLFILDLLEGKLSQWKVVFAEDGNSLWLSRSMMIPEQKQITLLVDPQKLQTQRLLAFMQLYSGSTVTSSSPFSDLIQKLSHQVKRLIQLKHDYHPVKAFEAFLRQEYQPFYGKTMLLTYLTIGLPEVAVHYFLSLYNEDLSSELSLHSYWICERVFQQLFPDLSLQDDLSCIFSCHQFDRLMTDSPPVRSSYQLWSFLFTENTATGYVSSEARIRWLLSDSSRLSQYFLLISQIMNPVILSSASSSNKSGLEESLYLRLFFIKILSEFQSFCQRAKDGDDFNDCQRIITEETITSIVRGFFLQAYSGVNLLSQFYEKFIRPSLLSEYYSAVEEHSSDANQFYCLREVLPQSVLPLLSDSVAVTSFLQFSPLRDPQLLAENSFVLSSKAMLSSQNQPKVIKIGVLSYSLSRHSVGRLFAKVIAYLADPSHHSDLSFEVYILTDQPHSQQSSSSSSATSSEYDDITRYLESIIPPNHWIALGSTLSIFHPKQFEQMTRIQQLGLQVLIYTDVLMQPTQYLFAYSYRLATYQLLFWGHPYTSSNPLIDYYITSRSFESDHPLFLRNQQFTEQLVYFDSLSFQLYPPETSPEQDQKERFEPSSVSEAVAYLLQKREAFLYKLVTTAATIEGNVLFDYLIRKDQSTLFVSTNQSEVVSHYLSTFPALNPSDPISITKIHFYATLQSLMKMHSFFDQVIVQLLLTDPHAVIILLMHPKQYHWFQMFKKRLLSLANENSIPPSVLQTRILGVKSMKHIQYAETICSMDVVLDPFPFGGGVTMCDAVAGPCRDRSVNGLLAMNRGKQYESVPFVTVHNLQSVQAIGVGIAKQVNNTKYGKWIDDHVSTVSEAIRRYDQIRQRSNERDSNETIHSLFGNYVDEINNEYVHEAHLMAIDSEKRFTEAQVPIAINIRSEDRTDPHQLIYDQIDPLLEWRNFLIRLTR